MTSPAEPSRCRVCGHTVELVDRYCARCGHDLSAGFVPLVDEETEAAEAGAAEASGGPSQRIAVGVLAAVVLVIAVVGVVAWLGGSDETVPEQSRSTPALPDDDGPSGGPAGGAVAEEPQSTRRTEARPGPTPGPPMLDEESGLMVVVRAEEGILVIDLDTGERVVIDVAAGTFEGSIPTDTVAVVGSELWVLTDDALRSFELSTLAEVDSSDTSSTGPVDLSQVVGMIAGPSPDDGVVTVDGDGIHVVHRPGADATPFIVPPGFEVFGVHSLGIVLTRPEIGGAWLFRDGEPGRITVGLPLALSAAGLFVLDCDDDLVCSFDVVDVETGETIRSVEAGATPTLPDPGTVSLLAPDGSTWVLAGQGTTEQTLDLDTGGRIPGLVTGIVTAAAYSPDSRWLFLAGDAADRALLTGVPVDFSLPQRTIATDVDLGAAVEVLVFERPNVS